MARCRDAPVHGRTSQGEGDPIVPVEWRSASLSAGRVRSAGGDPQDEPTGRRPLRDRIVSVPRTSWKEMP
jgi:hypothetical protein